MSQYATPFLLLNLGAEMLFVVSQRLQAQNISQDRATHVLDEITSSLIDQQMITDLLKIQEIYTDNTIKQLIDGIAQSSIMRLDPVSMDRLWDLITMVFKWQITLSQNVIGVTMRHLYEIETFTTNPNTQLQLHRVQNIIENFNKILSADEKSDLNEAIIIWLHNFNVRVSLLLKLGFQHQDGTFKDAHIIDMKYASMLENIGENIYATTKKMNLSKAEAIERQCQQSQKYELNTMIHQILGEENPNSENNAQFFKLTLCDTYEKAECDQFKDLKQIYSEIDVSCSTSALQELFNDLNTFEDCPPAKNNIHEELLNIIDENC